MHVLSFDPLAAGFSWEVRRIPMKAARSQGPFHRVQHKVPQNILEALHMALPISKLEKQNIS